MKYLWTILIITIFQYTYAASIDVHVVGMKNTDGQVIIQLYNSKKSFTISNEAYLVKTIKLSQSHHKINASFDDLPEGHYAVLVIDDINANNILDTNVFHESFEPIGFSHGYQNMLLPDFDKAKFSLSSNQNKALNINLY